MKEQKMKWSTKVGMFIAGYLPIFAITIPTILAFAMDFTYDLMTCKQALLASFVKVTSVIDISLVTSLIFIGWPILKNDQMKNQVLTKWLISSVVNLGIIIYIFIIFYTIKSNACMCLMNLIIFKSAIMIAISVILLVLSTLGIIGLRNKIAGKTSRNVKRVSFTFIIVILIALIALFNDQMHQNKYSRNLYNKYLKSAVIKDDSQCVKHSIRGSDYFELQ